MKKIISLLLVVAIVFSLMAGMNVNSFAAFSPRFSAPAKSGWYANYSRNNCVAYARCRANEILGYSVNWASGNGGQGFWKTSGFQHGSTPKLGAVACWSGHCAVVESINGSNIVLSEGHYSFQPSSSSYKNVVINGGGGSAGTWFDNYYGTILSSGKPSECTSQTWYGYVYLINEPSVDVTAPTISFNKSSYIIGETAKITWSASPSGSNLKHYWLVITNTTTGKQYHGASVGTNSYSLKLTEAGNIKVDVYAVRQDGSGKSDSKTFSVRANATLNIGENFYAYIIKKDSWKHLANENNNLQLASKGNDSYSPRQIWHFIRQTNGSYKIISEYDGQSLDADGRGTANETNVKLYNSYDTDAQKWFIYQNGSGYNIASSYCDKVFDVAGSKDVAGTNVQLYTSNSTSAQIFSIYKITTDGWTYQKPSAPSKPAVSTNVKSKTVTVSWSKSAVSGKMDNREYDIRIYKNSLSGEPIFVKYGLTGTSYLYSLSDSGTYYVTIAAVNSKYYNYFTVSNAVKFTISSTCSHTYTNKITKEATCTTAGTRKYTCTKCGYYYTTSIATLGHDLKSKVYRNAKIDQNGSSSGDTVEYCTRCNYQIIHYTAIGFVNNTSLNKSAYTYSGNIITPTVKVVDRDGNTLKNGIDYSVKYASGRKNVGKYAVKIIFQGKYTGSRILHFKILPKGTSLSKLTAGKKAFNAKWKRQTAQTSGYQLQYSTNAKYSGAKTVAVKNPKAFSKTIKGLAAKKYYVARIRTYKTVGGVNYYSAWSRSLKVKTK